MGTGNINGIIYAPGRLAVDCTDLEAAWPHGGSGLGLVEGVRLLPQVEPIIVEGAEYGGEPTAVGYAGQDPVLLVDLREPMDDDVITLAWANVGGGAGAKVARHPGAQRAGRSPAPRVLVFTPDDWAEHPLIYAYSAAPLMRPAAVIPWSVLQECRYPMAFRLHRDGDGDAYELGLLSDVDDIVDPPSPPGPGR